LPNQDADNLRPERERGLLPSYDSRETSSESAKPLISLIIPVCNEERRIPRCLNRVSKFMERSPLDLEVILAEDGSTDRTLEIATDFAKRNPWIRVVTSSTRLGKGGGILNGVESSHGNVVVYIDADLSTTPEQIPSLVEAIQEGYDVAIGSRLHPRSYVTGAPRHRVLLGRIFNAVVRLLFRLRYFDTQVGFKAFKREALSKILSYVNTDGFAFDVDLIVKAEKLRYKIKEIEIAWRYMPGSTVSPIGQAWKMFLDVLRIRLELLSNGIARLRSPMAYKRFYDSIRGDVYWKAERSLFIARRMWHKRRIDHVLANLQKDLERIVDVGSGSGIIMSRIASAHPQTHVIGIDLGSDFVRFSSQKAKQLSLGNVDIIEADGIRLPLRGNTADAAIVSEVLEYVSNPIGMLAEVNRVLKPEGRLIVTTPFVSLRWAIIRFLWTKVRKDQLESPHFPLNLSRLRYFLSKTGFQSISSKLLNFGCMLTLTATKTIPNTETSLVD